MRTDEVISILDEIALLLALKGENPFKARAYQHAARNIEAMDEDLDRVVREGRLSDIPGVGEALRKKITELVSTGKLTYYEDLKASVPPGHFDMLRIPGLGPKKIRALYERLHIATIGELEYACKENRLVELPGFGQKTQEKILAGIEHLKRYKERHLYADVIDQADQLVRTLSGHADVLSVSLAGSLRRCADVVKDIDLLASTRNPSAVAAHFMALSEVEAVSARGDTKVSVLLRSGINTDLRIVTPSEFPYALHHFTGSKEHNTALRGRAKRLGFKMNEYGLSRGDESMPCRSEEELFAALGLAYIPPELREDLGEIEAAEQGPLPRLIGPEDIRGVFHIHTRDSDGTDSLEALVRKARQMGLSYIGISDHSQSAYYAGGLSPDEIARQHALIDEMNSRLSPFHIFKGIEADILPDGDLDYNHDILSRFDFIIAAVHSHFNIPLAEMNARIMKALDNPFTTILAHPTGRLLLAREPYAMDLQMIIDHAAEKGKVIELNANPHRLDLDWRHCLYAKKKGGKIAINPDVHHLEGFQHLRFGLNIARKGWLEPQDCINCLELEEMTAFLSRGR